MRWGNDEGLLFPLPRKWGVFERELFDRDPKEPSTGHELPRDAGELVFKWNLRTVLAELELSVNCPGLRQSHLWLSC